MIGWGFNPGDFVPLLIFAIPIVAIVGGITAGIVRILGQQRLVELAQRERIAAIERGLDPSKLPPLPSLSGDEAGGFYASPFQSAQRRSQSLVIAGLVLLATGVSLAIFLDKIADEPGLWALGLIPGSVGVALLVSAWIVHPRNGERGAGTPPHAS